MKRKIEIWDFYVGACKENKGNIEKTNIKIKGLNAYVTLNDFISFYAIDDLIFIPFDITTVHKLALTM